MGVALPVPSDRTLSRRGQSVVIHLPKKARGAIDLVLDSSGLKVYSEAEWTVRQHGASKRRTWHKIHLAVDPDSQEIQAAMLSNAGMDDGEMLAPLLSQAKNRVKSVAGDGAYDKRKVYQILAEQVPHAQVNIPRARMPKFSNMAIALSPPCHGTRICGAFGKWVGSNGKKKRAIIAARWRKRLCSGSKRCSVTI